MLDINQIILAAAEAAVEAAQEGARAEESSGVLGTLGINWKLFLAQLVNFGIVLFVFWKWVVKPLAKTLSDRQERIESGLKNADYMEQEKKNFEQWRMNEMRKARDEADQISKSAIVEAEKAKAEINAATQTQAAKLLEQTRASIQSEKEQMLSDAKSELATLVVSASEKILRGKLDSKKDHELIDNALKNLK